MVFRISSHPIRNRLTQLYKTYSTNVTEITKAKDPEVAEIVKEKLLDRWGKDQPTKYWKNLYIDYKDVAVDFVQGCKDRPLRASVYFSLIGTGYYLTKHNPGAASHRESMLEASNKLMMVGESIRNPKSVNHLKYLEQRYNEGTIRRLTLGVVSFIWVDNYEKECAHYKATCSYLKPKYLTFHERIVDIGFMDKWWTLEDKMKDFDINETELDNFSAAPFKLVS